MIAVYDSVVWKNIDKDMAYMGSFPNLEAIGAYLIEYAHLFEGLPIMEKEGR